MFFGVLFLLVHLYVLLIYTCITYFVIFVSLAQYFVFKMTDNELAFKTKLKEKASEKQINWKQFLCHSSGQTADLSKLFWSKLGRRSEKQPKEEMTLFTIF